MFQKIQNEVNQSKVDIELLRNETATFLGTKSQRKVTKEEDLSQGKRGAHIGALAAAGIGLFGSGLNAGGSAECGITGIFGTCQDQSQTNAANIEHLGTLTSVLTTYISQLRTNTDEKFFMVSSKLKEIEEAQSQMTETQNKNWQVIQEQFNVILPDPLEHLMGIVPSLENHPYFESRTVAGVDLMKKIRVKVIHSPKLESSEDLVKIAMPITMEMSSL